jgi:hypothetical protein
MLSPSRNPLDPLDLDTVALRSFQAPDRTPDHATVRPRPEDAGDDDLRRLQSSIAWLKREIAIARLETEPPARERNLRLPRASQLPSVSGIRFLATESSSRRREALTVELRPPLPHERLQLPRPGRGNRNHLRAALYILIASGIVASIAYHVSAGGRFPGLAQAAQLQSQPRQPCRERCDSTPTGLNRALRGHGVGLWF